LGCNFDPPHRRPQLYAAARGAFVADLPAESDLSCFDQDTSDQGPLGACVGVSLARALQNRAAAQGQPSPSLPSALAIYHWARYEDWCLANPGTRATWGSYLNFVAQDSDRGTSHASAYAAIKSVGVPTEEAWPYDPSDTGSHMDTFRRRPSEDGERLAFDQRTIIVAQALDGDDSSRVTSLIHALAVAKQVVCVAVQVDQRFCAEAFDPTEPYARSGASVGGHALYVVGHRTEVDGSRSYKIHMSWGRGDFAYVWFTELYVLSGQLTAVEQAPSFSDGGAS
jgi:hypothetical protein